MTVQSSPTAFADCHVGARRQPYADTMLEAVGYDSLDGLVDSAVPDSIRQDTPLTLESALSEVHVLAESVLPPYRTNARAMAGSGAAGPDIFRRAAPSSL